MRREVERQRQERAAIDVEMDSDDEDAEGEEVGGMMEGRGMGLKLSRKGLPSFGYYRNFLDVLDNSVFEEPSANQQQ